MMYMLYAQQSVLVELMSSLLVLIFSVLADFDILKSLTCVNISYNRKLCSN